MKKHGWIRWARIAAAALFSAVFAAAFLGFAPAARALRIEFAPTLLRCVASFTFGALATLFALLLATWLFGRFYCAVLCPLGIWQDLATWLSRRKGRPERNHPRIRYFILGFALCALIGWVLPFMVLDPYSNAGRIVAGGFTFGALLPLVLVTLLALWKKRLYCTTLCPVGTLLGLAGARGLFRLQFTDKCVKCGACVKSCPAGCIDPAAGTLDNERCVRCLNCLSVCRLGGVEFTARRRRVETPAVAVEPEAKTVPPDPARREFIANVFSLIEGAMLGTLFTKAAAIPMLVGKMTQEPGTGLILPPGAGDEARFTMKCTACQLCTANCPAGIIVPAPGGYGPVRLDLSRGACLYDCDKCSAVCPTGALVPLGLEKKRRTKIARAKFDAAHCIVCQELKKCGKCAAACPAGAIALRGKLGVPKLDIEKCIGCGACQAACPAKPDKAMTVGPVPFQGTVNESQPTEEV